MEYRFRVEVFRDKQASSIGSCTAVLSRPNGQMLLTQNNELSLEYTDIDLPSRVAGQLRPIPILNLEDSSRDETEKIKRHISRTMEMYLHPDLVKVEITKL